ncbi:VOC family protein [Rhodanobacter lindaniclasticus]
MFPYLRVHDAAAALDYYQRALGATLRLRLDEAGSGRIGHAEWSSGWW